MIVASTAANSSEPAITAGSSGLTVPAVGGVGEARASVGGAVAALGAGVAVTAIVAVGVCVAAGSAVAGGAVAAGDGAHPARKVWATVRPPSTEAISFRAC